MALTSIKRFLAKSEEEAVYRRVIRILLDGLSANAVGLDNDARRSFRKRIGEIRQEMASETTVVTLLVNAGAVVEAIRDYSRESKRLLQVHSAEMQDMMAMLARTMVEIGGVGERAVARLRRLGDELENAIEVDEVSSLKERLRECLGAIRTEAKQQEADSDRMVQTLRQEVSRKQGLDPVTDLPGEAAAQTLFLSAIREGEPKHAAVFVLVSSRLINLRFGRPAGDEAIRLLKQFLAEQLNSADIMFRWPGPAIVALLAGTEPFERVCDRLNRFLDKPIERSVDANGHANSIPLSIAWSAFPLSIPLAVPNRQIYDFIAAQGFENELPPLPE
jgi:GGDEF domain-containing protein